MREIVLDTETTGLDPASGHRLVEIACVEIVNLVATGNTFHAYLNPMRDVPIEAFDIHGLSTEFLSTQPLFDSIARSFLDFIGDARLVIHNAEFDIKFINFELGRLGLGPIDMSRVFDTLSFARKKHPGASNSLDALCARYKINNAMRTKHGALLDSELLAEVYAELMGGRQTSLILVEKPVEAKRVEQIVMRQTLRRPVPLAPTIPDDEAQMHYRFVVSFGDNAIWRDYLEIVAPDTSKT